MPDRDIIALGSCRETKWLDDVLQQKFTQASTGNVCQVGSILEDGWIFLGISPKTNKPYSLEPAGESPDRRVFYVTAAERASKPNVRLPLEEGRVVELAGNELVDIYNKIIMGGHNDKARLQPERYFSGTKNPINYNQVRLRDMTNGSRRLEFADWVYTSEKEDGAMVRCVRDENEIFLTL